MQIVLKFYEHNFPQKLTKKETNQHNETIKKQTIAFTVMQVLYSYFKKFIYQKKNHFYAITFSILGASNGGLPSGPSTDGFVICKILFRKSLNK